MSKELESFNQKQDEKMFDENRQFYEDHKLEDLKLTNTGHLTPFGKKLYIDQFGVHHSEITQTEGINVGGKEVFVNVPRILCGNII